VVPLRHARPCLSGRKESYVKSYRRVALAEPLARAPAYLHKGGRALNQQCNEQGDGAGGRNLVRVVGMLSKRKQHTRRLSVCRACRPQQLHHRADGSGSS
jgi:hypothetical protein